MRISVLLLCFICLSANGQEKPPTIDVHLHALPVDHQGPPPLAMCTPMPQPVWDQNEPYEQVFMAMLKNPTCEDPVWSPTKDAELLSRTIAVMEGGNVFGVPSRLSDEEIARHHEN